MKTAVMRALLIMAATAVVGGCASYPSEPPRLAYFIVPCNTPGAFSAQPLSTTDDNLSDGPQNLLTEATDASPVDASRMPPTCLIAAAKVRARSPAFSGYGYAPYYPYPRHHGSGIGVGLHGGGHRNGHHVSSHRRH